MQRIDDYVQPQLYEPTENNMSSYKKLFRRNQSRNIIIYVIGNAGMGKTALCKHFAMTWCQPHSLNMKNSDKFFAYEEIEAIKRLEMLLLIRMFDSKFYSDVEEYYSHVLCGSNFYLKQFVSHLLEIRTCLVILDGLDEWTHPSFCAQNHVYFTVLTRSGPRKHPHQFTVKGDRQLQICDMSRNQSHTLVTKVQPLLKRYKQFYNIDEFTMFVAANVFNQHMVKLNVVSQLVNLRVNTFSVGIARCENYSTVIELSFKQGLRGINLENTSLSDTTEFLPYFLQNNRFSRKTLQVLLKFGQLALCDETNSNVTEINSDRVISFITESDLHLVFDIGFIPKTWLASTISSQYKPVEMFFAALYMRSLRMNEANQEAVVKASQCLEVSLEKFAISIDLVRKFDNPKPNKAVAVSENGQGKSMKMEYNNTIEHNLHIKEVTFTGKTTIGLKIKVCKLKPENLHRKIRRQIKRDSTSSVLKSNVGSLVTRTDLTRATSSLAITVKEAVRGSSQAKMGRQSLGSLTYEPRENDNNGEQHRKQFGRFFKDKQNLTVKDFVRELYIGHREDPVFGLWSYFDRLDRGERLSDLERMQYEWLRFASFEHYTGNGNALTLARNGFYHDHNDSPTATRCYLCEIRYSTWEYFDDIEAQHRRQSPECPFHANRSEQSTNISISYENSLRSPRNSQASNDSLNPTNSTPLMQIVSTSSVLTSSIVNSLTSTDSTSATASLASSVKEAIRGISQAQISSQSHESLVYQPQENDDNREHSLLALTNTRSFRVLGRSGETAYSHLTTPPRRNNIASGAASNASLDASPSNLPTSTASSTTSTLFRPSSLPGGPERAGSNASDTALISKATSRSASSTIQSNAGALAATGSLLRPPLPQGGGGRTDPTITVVVNNPKHPDYRELDERINSYQGWPEYLDQTPRQMAEAGFFFVGVADFTRCFCCGGGLRNWEPGDDPMLEHTRWFPRCEYANKLKGQRYVSAVQRRHQEHMAAQQREQLELAQQRDTYRNPPDPMTTEAAAVLREMGYQTERIRDAILAVRRQIGVPDVTTQQVLAWLLEQHEGRSPPTSSRSSPTRDLGVKVHIAIASSTSETCTPSTAISSATSMTFSGSSSKVKSTSGAVNQQQSSSSTSITQTGSMSTTEGKISNQIDPKVNETKNSKTLEKQLAATEGESEEEFKSAEETLSAEAISTETKETKKTTSKSSRSDTKTLKEENEKLREMQTCKICMERLVNTTLLPCGHLVCCDICASRLNRCPICRKRINGTVKTFMS